ncbi:MAG: hypothetical protein ACXABY_09450 [Candidatus Thorarchaeota archaeon]|jgi:hypothetical protein
MDIIDNSGKFKKPNGSVTVSKGKILKTVVVNISTTFVYEGEVEDEVLTDTHPLTVDQLFGTMRQGPLFVLGHNFKDIGGDMLEKVIGKLVELVGPRTMGLPEQPMGQEPGFTPPPGPVRVN